jgi:hypothetical protein
MSFCCALLGLACAYQPPRPVTAAIAIRERDTPLDDGVKAMVETATATAENKLLDAVYRGHTTVYRERHREGVEESERPMELWRESVHS